MSDVLPFLRSVLRLPAPSLLKSVRSLVVVYSICYLDWCSSSVVVLGHVGLWILWLKPGRHLAPHGSFHVRTIYSHIIGYPCDRAFRCTYNFLAWRACRNCFFCGPRGEFIVFSDVYVLLPPVPATVAISWCVCLPFRQGGTCIAVSCAAIWGS